MSEHTTSKQNEDDIEFKNCINEVGREYWRETLTHVEFFYITFEGHLLACYLQNNNRVSKSALRLPVSAKHTITVKIHLSLDFSQKFIEKFPSAIN